MPIDPAIANPVTLKLADPSEQMGTALKNAYLMEEINKYKRAEDDDQATNDLIKRNYNPDKNTYRNSLMADAAQSGHGKIIPGMQKEWSEQDAREAKAGLDKADATKATAEAGKFDTEAIAKELENVKPDLQNVDRNDPVKGLQQYSGVVDSMFKNPRLGPWLVARGKTPESFMTPAQTDAAKGPAAWAGRMLGEQIGAEKMAEMIATPMKGIAQPDGTQAQNIVLTPKFGGGPSHIAPGSQQSYVPPKPPQVSVSVDATRKATSAFGKTLGEKEAEGYYNLGQFAQGVPASINKLDRMIDLVRSEKVLTGAGAGAKLEVLRGLQQAGQLSPEQQEILNNTQEFDKYLSQNILEQTAALNKAGLGARTSKFEVEQVIAGNARKELESPAIMHLLLNQRRDLQDAVPRFNARSKDLQGTDLEPTLKALASHPIAEIPDHPAQIEADYHDGMRGANGKPVNIKQYVNIRMHPETAGAFDEHFGPGSAERILGRHQPSGGGTPTGAAPFLPDPGNP